MVLEQDTSASYFFPLEKISQLLEIFDKCISYGEHFSLSFIPKKRFSVDINVNRISISDELGLSNLKPLMLGTFTDKYNSEILIRFSDEGYLVPLKIFENWVIALKALLKSRGIIPNSE